MQYNCSKHAVQSMPTTDNCIRVWPQSVYITHAIQSKIAGVLKYDLKNTVMMPFLLQCYKPCFSKLIIIQMETNTCVKNENEPHDSRINSQNWTGYVYWVIICKNTRKHAAVLIYLEPRRFLAICGTKMKNHMHHTWCYIGSH